MPAAVGAPQAAISEIDAVAGRKTVKPAQARKVGGGTIRVKVRLQGGARIMTIPPAILRQLGLDTGTELAVGVRGGKLVAEPVLRPTEPMPVRGVTPRYTLADLLVGAEHLPEIYASVAGSLDGEPVGRETL